MNLEEVQAQLRRLGYNAHGIILDDSVIDKNPELEPGYYWAVLPVGTEFRFNQLDQVVYFAGPHTDYESRDKDMIKAIKWVESQSQQERMERIGLIGAVQMGDIEAVRWRLDHRADVNAREDDNNGCTALLYVQENHYLDIVKALSAKGADVNMGDNNGRTPLICACRLGNTGIVKDLLAAGAEVNTKDNVVWTALNQANQQLHESSGDECYTEIIQLLKQAGARE